MKKLILGLLVVGFCKSLKAAPLVAEAPINGSGTPVTVAISSTTLTKVPTTQTSGRMGVFISVPTPNTGVTGFYGDCTSTAFANTIRPIEISTATGRFPNAYFSMREDVCLWLLSLNTATSSQNIHYQEVKQ